MFKYTKIFLMMAAFVAMISLQSCSDDNPVVTTDNVALYTSSSITADVFSSNPLEVASPDAIAINDDIVALDGKPNPSAKVDLGPLGFALGQLKLTPEQKAAITEAAKAYKDCITAATQAIRDAEKAIMTQLKNDVKAILDQVKAGTMTKQDARTQINELQKAAKAAMDAIPGRAAAQAAVKDCLKKYTDTVRGLLTPDQIALLDKILTGKGNGGGKDNPKVVKVDGPLGPVLGGLGLNDAQVKAANDCATKYKECYTLAMAPIQQAEKAIMDALKAQRDQIMADLKAGKMTREEANKAMQVAEQGAKQQMAEIKGRAEAEAAAKKCYTAYVDCIKGIPGLTKDQLDKINKATGTNTGGGTGGGVVKIDGPLGPVLGGLGLTETQAKYANDCAKKYNDCYAAAMKPIAEQEKMLMDIYNKKVEAVMIDLKTGKITQDEANTLLTNYKIEVSNLLANIPGRDQAQLVAKKCYDAYILCVKSIPELTAAQLEKLNLAIGTTKP